MPKIKGRAAWAGRIIGRSGEERSGAAAQEKGAVGGFEPFLACASAACIESQADCRDRHHSSQGTRSAAARCGRHLYKTRPRTSTEISICVFLQELSALGAVKPCIAGQVIKDLELGPGSGKSNEQLVNSYCLC